MSCLAGIDAATTADWPDLVDELDRWGAAGRVARLWWRDDDAAAPAPRLGTLLAIADRVPVALAVIPALAGAALASALEGTPEAAVLQHGWQHADRAAGSRKSEYPAGRPRWLVAAEIAAGRARLGALFGARALPVFVPPWNRFDEEFLPLLRAAGIVGLSGMATRRVGPPRGGLARLDVDLDLVAWRRDRGFIGAAAALGGLVGRLRAVRLGGAAAAIGILTHHLMMDRATAAFLGRLLRLTGSHAAVRWTSIAELMR
jgi:hypothetical protein